ncbi:MAG TPA: GNAT family N-acetyltransferase [Paracoccaceae bacterium]|nr:GNAT family N-acetyltransferase [Paracoccaceae bacterium]
MAVFRAPRQGEAGMLTELCLRAKASWGYDAAFMAACRAELTVAPGDLLGGSMQVVELAGAPVGLVELRLEDGAAELEKLFVAPEAQGAGIGAALFGWAAARARACGAAWLRIDSDPGAEGFYLRMGAERAGSAPSRSIPGRMLPRLRFRLGPV